MTPAASVVDTRAAFRGVFPGVMVALFLASLDQTILAAALPAIAASLGGLADLSWIAVAYLLTVTVSAPLYGHLGDRFGRRRVLLIALALFTCASLACAVAPTFAVLIAARALQGLGGGGLMTLSQALIGEHVPPRERGRFQGYFAAVFAVSSTLGPVLGGYLTEHFSWRAAFAINLPLGAVAAWLALRIPASARTSSAPFQLDIPGIVLFSIGATTLLYALTQWNRIGLISPAMLALVVVAAASLGALLWWERRAADPLIPVRLLAIPAISYTDAMVFCFAAALFGTLLYLPLYLQLAHGFGIGESGLLLVPVTLTMALTATLTGKLISSTGRLTVFPTVGLALSTAAFATLAATASSATALAVVALVIAAAFGLGTVMPASQILVQDSAGAASLGAATASISVSRSIGGAFGAAVVGALIFSVVAGHDVALAQVLQRLPENGVAALDSLTATQRAAVTTRIDAAFSAAFSLLAILTAIGCALALAVPRRRL